MKEILFSIIFLLFVGSFSLEARKIVYHEEEYVEVKDAETGSFEESEESGSKSRDFGWGW